MNTAIYIPIGSYHEWEGIWYVFLAAAFLITLWHWYKKKQVYQISNYLLFVAYMISAIAFYAVDIQYLFSQSGIVYDFKNMLSKDYYTFICFAVMFIYFTVAVLMDYHIIKPYERDGKKFLWGTIVVSVIIQVCLILFVHPAPTVEQQLLLTSASSLREADIFPLLYLMILEDCRASLMKTKELKNE